MAIFSTDLEFKYDENGRVIYIEYPEGNKYYFKYDKNGYGIEITKQEFENIKIREYNSRTKCSRFEIMDI